MGASCVLFYQVFMVSQRIFTYYTTREITEKVCIAQQLHGQLHRASSNKCSSPLGCTNHLTAIKMETQAPRFRGEMYTGREERESAAVGAALSSSRSGSARIGAVRSR